LTFDRILSSTTFVEDMRRALRTLQDAYNYPVDVEFTLNFFDGDAFKINLVQCRPLQVSTGAGGIKDPPTDIPEEDLLLETHGAVIGKSLLAEVDWFIYVVPSVYGALPLGDRYTVARAIGEVAHHEALEGGRIMLVGPGRWGTTSPELGVPVSFMDIRPVSVLCEVVTMRENLVPDVSLGTHFFNELVENNMLYMAVFPKQEASVVQTRFFEETTTNRLAELLPEQAARGNALRVVDASREKGRFRLNANVLQQRVVCYRTSSRSTV
jgi:hypothetical protein